MGEIGWRAGEGGGGGAGALLEDAVAHPDLRASCRQSFPAPQQARCLLPPASYSVHFCQPHEQSSTPLKCIWQPKWARLEVRAQAWPSGQPTCSGGCGGTV